MELDCPCDLQSKEECDLCRDKDTAEKAIQRYTRQLVKTIRDKLCDHCGKKIYKNSDYIYESWIGEHALVESRNSHTECF